MRIPGEAIARAAVFHDGVTFSVDQPGRHHDVCHKMAEIGIDTCDMREQGFVTSAGRFVSRKAACRLAQEAGQLGKVRPKTNPIDVLFSEDVW